MVEEGVVAAEIESFRKRKEFKQEDHNYDCGSVFGPPEDVVLTIALVAGGSCGVAVAYPSSSDACCGDSSESSQD